MINNFWKLDTEFSFTGNETKLYFYLLNVSNNLGWKNPIRQSLRQIQGSAGIALNTIKVSQKKLIEAGLLEIKNGSAGSHSDIKNKTQYKLLSVSFFDTETNTEADNQNDTQTDTINKQNNNKPKSTPPTSPENWRNNFDVYLEELKKAYRQLINDTKFIKEQEQFHPEVNIYLTMKKSCKNYWGTEEGWKNKKKKKTRTIDWKQTLATSISQQINKVYLNKEEKERRFIIQWGKELV